MEFALCKGSGVGIRGGVEVCCAILTRGLYGNTTGDCSAFYNSVWGMGCVSSMALDLSKSTQSLQKL